jgi:hypothetical protein
MRLIAPFTAAAIALIAALLSSTPAIAQGCPAGTTPNPGGPGGPVSCIPITDWNSSSSGPRGHWATRFGAVAYDPDTGAVGLSTGQTSKKKALAAALEHCRSKGGTACLRNIEYSNQCVASVSGVAPDGTYTFTSASAATEAKAEAFATEDCEKTGSSGCKTFYTGCSLPEWIG